MKKQKNEGQFSKKNGAKKSRATAPLSDFPWTERKNSLKYLLSTVSFKNLFFSERLGPHQESDPLSCHHCSS